VRGPLEALRSETARALDTLRAHSGVEFVAPAVRIEGEDRRLEFPPRLDEHGEAIREEFDLP